MAYYYSQPEAKTRKRFITGNPSLSASLHIYFLAGLFVKAALITEQMWQPWKWVMIRDTIEAVTLFNDCGYETLYYFRASPWGDFQLMFCQVCLKQIIVPPQCWKSWLARLCFVRSATRQKTESLSLQVHEWSSPLGQTHLLTCSAQWASPRNLAMWHLQTMKDLLQPKSFFTSHELHVMCKPKKEIKANVIYCCINISLAHGKHDQNNNFTTYHYYTYIPQGKLKKLLWHFKNL